MPSLTMVGLTRGVADSGPAWRLPSQRLQRRPVTLLNYIVGGDSGIDGDDDQQQ